MTKPIQIFLRHCYYSKLQELPDRKRPKWFDKHKVFKNFKKTINSNIADYCIIYDEHYGDIKKTFLSNEKNVKIVNCGSEGKSFVKTLEYIKSINFDPETIIYFLEDDYLHRPGWCEILLEGFLLKSDYVTLYPCELVEREDFLYKIFTTENTYWRVLPVTTNTFACKFSTLLKDYDIHLKYSIQNNNNEYICSNDYKKFWDLNIKQNKYIVAPISGYSTHCDQNYLTPFVNWKKIINVSTEYF